MPLTLNAAIAVLAIAALILVFQSLWARRQGIAYRLWLTVKSEIAYLGVTFIAVALGVRGPTPILLGIIAALIVHLRYPARKRYVPTSIRRQTVRKYERKSGQKFNRRKQELDHVVPFSRGGSHTTDNLRVIEKRANRAKGDASPWWDVFGRR
jgi:hypothetical protein